ncbi:DNA-binding NarL/FixJ family response regulator [Hymenobacter luteus]|uniref:DNA-binding NarL/FixJ family response regulator n=2 Tax=Hymenobacter TaxID=89966 RepID=A0A7W9WCR3_9BACT|nr:MULTISPECIES: response regulator transcription factor [Hymenobacter]MBB4600866.1 DNA-binding NarL/FixJ family response regulator [Hymenobacter latericoloratus]MBB6058927.1 DNA-binding NarL/FixJ family response regulator [Hymenobacter luteus]
MSEPLPEDEVISLLLVDDHPVVVEGLKSMLRPEARLRVAAQAYSGAEALHLLATHWPNIQVAVLDLNMPEMSGIELARTIRTQWPSIRVLILSMFHDHATVAEMLEAGGSGYVLKTATRTELTEAILQVAAGRNYFSQDVAATLLQNLHIPAALEANRPADLTNREREILGLIAQEYSNQAIAEMLFISERTVETHRRNLFTKTNSKSVVGLIQYALRHKLIS